MPLETISLLRLQAFGDRIQQTKHARYSCVKISHGITCFCDVGVFRRSAGFPDREVDLQLPAADPPAHPQAVIFTTARACNACTGPG
jgi:hypothetical protein